MLGFSDWCRVLACPNRAARLLPSCTATAEPLVSAFIFRVSKLPLRARSSVRTSIPFIWVKAWLVPAVSNGLRRGWDRSREQERVHKLNGCPNAVTGTSGDNSLEPHLDILFYSISFFIFIFCRIGCTRQERVKSQSGSARCPAFCAPTRAGHN